MEVRKISYQTISDGIASLLNLVESIYDKGNYTDMYRPLSLPKIKQIDRAEECMVDVWRVNPSWSFMTKKSGTFLALGNFELSKGIVDILTRSNLVPYVSRLFIHDAEAVDKLKLKRRPRSLYYDYNFFVRNYYKRVEVSGFETFLGERASEYLEKRDNHRRIKPEKLGELLSTLAQRQFIRVGQLWFEDMNHISVRQEFQNNSTIFDSIDEVYESFEQELPSYQNVHHSPFYIVLNKTNEHNGKVTVAFSCLRKQVYVVSFV